ncbi:MAG: hypothetical protein K5829_00945 [Treponema sp.]|nr:hypothetical protein [Treponema sp.]
MADEKIKVKIVPARFTHYLGEVEITIPEPEIEKHGYYNAYINTLEDMKKCVETSGFLLAVRNNTDYNKINTFYLSLGYDLERDQKNIAKDLKLWFCESLEDEIKRVQTDKEDEIQADRTTQTAAQAEPEKKEVQTALLVNDNNPMYVSDLLEVGLIDTYFRCDSLEKVAVFIMQNKEKYQSDNSNFEITTTMLRQFKQLDGSEYSKAAISKAKKAAKDL